MTQKKSGYAALLSLLAATLPNVATAVDVPLNSSDLSNGITDIYSATFDGGINPDCTGAPDPDECDFFNGQPPPNRAITTGPNPSEVAVGAPRGITPQPPDGSFLDLDLGAGNTQLTLNTGVVYIAELDIVLQAGTPDQTVIKAFDIGIALKNFSPMTELIDGNGVAIFEIDTAPTISADFSTFTVIVDLANDCTGNLCALIPILSLDMIRFRLSIDYDSTFGSFKGDFVGQTANNSIVSMTLNSGVPSIQAPASVSFGSVTEMTTANRTVTITNTGTGDLVLGTTVAPAAPFSVPSDMCSGQTLTPGQTCVIGVQFAPQSTGEFPDSLQVPSNDAANPTVTVNLAGTGTAMPVPNIDVTDSIPRIDDLRLPYGDVTVATQRDETVTITNNGNAGLIVGDVGLIDTLLLPFSIANNTCSPAPATLTPSQSCTLTLRFEPTATGNFTDSFDIPSNDPDEPSVIVSVAGTGIATATPDIRVIDSIDPNDDLQLPYGDIWEFFTIDETITLINDGNADLVIGTIAAPAAPFEIVNDPCSGQTLAPSTSCIVDVSFTAAKLATFNDAVDIPSNDPDEATVTVSLSGTGIPPQVGEKLSTEPSGSNGGFFGAALAPQTLLILLLLPALRSRRRGARE